MDPNFSIPDPDRQQRIVSIFIPKIKITRENMIRDVYFVSLSKIRIFSIPGGDPDFFNPGSLIQWSKKHW
jgi:hypothetical protein